MTALKALMIVLMALLAILSLAKVSWKLEGCKLVLRPGVPRTAFGVGAILDQMESVPQAHCKSLRTIVPQMLRSAMDCQME